MAPEQARGELDTLDERADVFALGSILCEILTGQPAFAGGTAAEVYRKAKRADLSDALAHGSTRATPTRSWWGWRGRASPPRRSTGRETRARWSPGCRRISAASSGG